MSVSTAGYPLKFSWGRGIHSLRAWFATHLLEAGVRSGARNQSTSLAARFRAQTVPFQAARSGTTDTAANKNWTVTNVIVNRLYWQGEFLAASFRVLSEELE